MKLSTMPDSTLFATLRFDRISLEIRRAHPKKVQFNSDNLQICRQPLVAATRSKHSGTMFFKAPPPVLPISIGLFRSTVASLQRLALFAVALCQISGIGRAAEFTESPGVALPEIPDRQLDVTRFGAQPNFAGLSTGPIQKAIDSAAAAGGGRVVIPAGVFVSGPIHQASHVDLHLEKGAVLKMSPRPADYQLADGKVGGGFVMADHLHDIRLSGEGTIDGQGSPWWSTFRKAKMSGSALPRRPQMVWVTDCQRVEVEGITTLNPPNIHFAMRKVKDLTIHGITANAPGDSPNTDALNLGSVQDVLIEGCHIATGDDNIVLDGGSGRGNERTAVENVTIRNCDLGVGHGLSIGSYTGGGVRNVTAENITFEGTTCGIRLKAWRDRGGLVEELRYRNLSMRNVRYPIFICSYYPHMPAGPAPAQDLPSQGHTNIPIWRNISISGLTATGASTAMILWGLPDQPITNVTCENIHIESQSGAMFFHARDIAFSGSQIDVSAGPRVELYDAWITGMEGVPLEGATVKIR